MKKQDHATKQQHWVPQLYLKGWASGNKRVWCFDKVTKKAFATETSNIGGGMWFNDIEETRDESNPETHQIIESFLAEVEGKLAPLICALREDAELTAKAFPDEPVPPRKFLNGKQRTNFAYFMALQSLRTDEVRAHIRKTFTEVCQRGMEATLPIGFPELNPKDWVVQIAENEIKRIHIETFMQFKDYMPYFRDKYWTYGINTNPEPLFTSDNPVVKIPLKPLDDGLDSFGIQLLFPVSPHLVVTMYDWKAFPRAWDNRVAFLKAKTVSEYNLLQLKQCRRQIYGSENNFESAYEYCKENPEDCKLDSKLPEFPEPLLAQLVADMVQAAKNAPKFKGATDGEVGSVNSA